MSQRARTESPDWHKLNHAYDASLDDLRTKNGRYDLEYFECQSLLEDVRTTLPTVPVMLFRRGGL